MTVTLYVSAPPAAPGSYQKGATLAIEGTSIQEVAAELNAHAGDEVAETLLRDIIGSNLARAVLVTDTDGAPAADKTAPEADDRASDTLLKAAAKKSGKSVEELQGLSTAEAKALMKGEK